MENPTELQVAFNFLGSKEIIVEATAGELTSDAGLLPFRQLDEQLGLTQRFAETLTDTRAAVHIDHTFLEMVRMRRLVAVPPPAPAPRQELPNEALAGKQRRDLHNRRREADPLGEGHVCTWRTRLIKVAGYITQSTRRIVVRLSSNWPYPEHYQAVGERVLPPFTANSRANARRCRAARRAGWPNIQPDW